MSNVEHYSAEEIISAIKNNRGMVYLAAEELQCDPKTIYNYKTRYPEIEEAIKNCRAVQTDKTEIALFDLIEAGDFRAIAYWLNTQAGVRGYGKEASKDRGDEGPQGMPGGSMTTEQFAQFMAAAFNQKDNA